jgi:hypothetical protein
VSSSSIRGGGRCGQLDVSEKSMVFPNPGFFGTPLGLGGLARVNDEAHALPLVPERPTLVIAEVPPAAVLQSSFFCGTAPANVDGAIA